MSSASPLLYQRSLQQTPGWPSSPYYSTQTADIGGAPLHPLASSSKSSINSSMTSSLTARPRLSQSRFAEEEHECRRKLSRSRSASSRALAAWRRRRRGEEAEAGSGAGAASTTSAPESPLSSAVKGLSLPHGSDEGTSKATAPARKRSIPSPPPPLQSPPSSMHGSSNSTGGLSRLFSARRKGRTVSVGGGTSSSTGAEATSRAASSDANQGQKALFDTTPQSAPLARTAASTPLLPPAQSAAKQTTAQDEVTMASDIAFPPKSPLIGSEDSKRQLSSEMPQSARPTATALHRSKSLSLASRLTSRFGSVDATTRTAAGASPVVQPATTDVTSPLPHSPSKPSASLSHRIRKFSLTKTASKATTPTLEDAPKPFVGRSPSILNALDLRYSSGTATTSKDSPAVQSSAASPTLVRLSQGRRPRTASRDGLTQQGPASPTLSLEGHVRKLSLRGFNPFKATQARPSTVGGGEKAREGRGGGVRKEDQDGLGLQLPQHTGPRMLATPDLSGSPMSSRVLLRSAGIQSRMSDDRTPRPSTCNDGAPPSALGFISGEERPGTKTEFVSGLDAISSGWTESSSVRSSLNKKRKPVPKLDALDSLLASHAPHRPYSLISTDTDGNDTPILGLRRLVVDTSEGDEERERQSRFFFRPPTAGGTRISPTSSSITQDAQNDQGEQSPATTTSVLDAGPLNTGASVTSSGSSTLNVRVITEKMHNTVLQRQWDVLASQERRRQAEQVDRPTQAREQEDEQQQRLSSSPRNSNSNSNRHSGSGTGAALSPGTSYDGPSGRRESNFSSHTDTSVNEAVLSRATSTRLHVAPLRKMKVEEWAQKISSTEQAEQGEGQEKEGAVEETRKEAPFGGLQADFTFRAPASEDAGQRLSRSPQSSLNLSEAARLGRAPAKRAKVQSPNRPSDAGKGESHADEKNKERPESKAPAGEEKDAVDLHKPKPLVSRHSKQESSVTTSSSLKTLKPSRSGNTLQPSRDETGDMEEKGWAEGQMPAMRKSKSEIRTSKSKKESSHTRSSSKKSYLTSEEAATARRCEQEERARASRERKLRKELARQEAYAQKKRQDPLLKMRLALAGLAPPDSPRPAEQADALTTPYNQVANVSSSAVSKASFHTAIDDTGKTDDEPRLVKQHRRNQTSTSSALTTNTRSRTSSVGTLATASFLPFPEPPQRHDVPIKSEDGTVLARARLQSQDSTALAVQQDDSVNGDPLETPRAKPRLLPDDSSLHLLHGQHVPLSKGASIREAPTKPKKPEMVMAVLREQLQHDDEARMRHRSQVPEILDRFSTQSLSQS